MTLSPKLIIWLFGAQLALSQSLALASSTISTWRRPAKNYGMVENPIPVKTHSISLSKLQPKKVSVFDYQYDRNMNYHAIPFAVLLQEAENAVKLKGEDGVILHFDNGIRQLLDLDLNNREGDIFLATKIIRNNKLSTKFPKIVKPDPLFRDPRPITFQGNKLVVSGQFVGVLKRPERLPFRHSSTLTGLEFINIEAYKKQFFIEKGKVTEGANVFVQRCHSCHGVMYVGGRSGWDFVTPIPIFKKRDPESLMYHVKYKKIDRLERGLMMPNQPDFTLEEAKDLWTFMKAATNKAKVNTYAP